MPEGAPNRTPLDPAKFQNPLLTATGDERASVSLSALKTLWFNTGSLCNITCAHCYMDSSPSNDDLAYLGLDHVLTYLDEIRTQGLNVHEIGFTGGEPFMNRDLIKMLEAVLQHGHSALVLTNAMKPMWQKRAALRALADRFDTSGVQIRVSVDHYTQHAHEKERGSGTWVPMEKGVQWLAAQDFSVSIAGRTLWNEAEDQTRRGYQQLCDAWGLSIDCSDPAHLVLFPEMDAADDVPEITTRCWELLKVRPDAMMCATSRMVVLHKGDAGPRIAPCTLLPYDRRFDMGALLTEAHTPVALNHPHCAKFCVLGGASCSAN